MLKVRQPIDEEVKFFRERGTLISFLYPVQNETLVQELSKKQMTVFGRFCHLRLEIIIYVGSLADARSKIY